MSYLRRPSRVPRGQLSGLGGILDSLSSALGLPGSGNGIEMPEDYVGNLNSLPLCSSSAVGGGQWCRNYIGGSAVKKPASVAVATTTPAAPKPTGPSTADVIGSIFKSLTGSFGTQTMTPAAQVAALPQPGMSTGTKLAIAGGAVAVVALIATRR